MSPANEKRLMLSVGRTSRVTIRTSALSTFFIYSTKLRMSVTLLPFLPRDALCALRGICQTPLCGNRLRTPVPPTDELTTILQLVVQQIHHQRTKNCHIPTSGHVEMLGSAIAMWQICCRIVVSSSVGGVRWWCCATCS